ncbi:hypothetical protein AMJ47_00220 [Parcubacteria bacterium DG_72]|nr:MAG: hypothetical protein AMJ47_00220 [Parcubacteria bacterium DG_72]
MKIIANIILYMISPDGQIVVLLQKKWNHPLHKDRWCIFGGHKKKKESPKKAAKREIRKETGINVKEPKRFGVFKFNNFGGLSYHVYYSELTCQLSEISLTEGGGFALLNPAEIKKLPLIGNDRKILEKFFSFLARS